MWIMVQKFGVIPRMHHKQHLQLESLKGKSTQRPLFLNLVPISSMEDY